MSAVRAGFSVADFEHLTIGMIFECFDELTKKDNIREATQADIDKL